MKNSLCLRDDRRLRGLTLIELLTVIAIIGILAAIIIPVSTTVRENARASQCMSNVRQLALANLNFASENKGQLLVFLKAKIGNEYILPDHIRDPQGNNQNNGLGNWQKTLASYMGLDRTSARSRFVCAAADASTVPAGGIESGSYTTYTVSMFLHGATSGGGRLNAMDKPIVMVAELPFKNYDGTYPWNVNAQGVNNADRRGMFPHKNSRSVALTDGSARSLKPSQDGIFKQGGSFLPSPWLQVGSNPSASRVTDTPTDTLPGS